MPIVDRYNAYAPVGPGTGVPTVGELECAHKEYRCDLINQYQTWYDGGDKFRDALKCDSDGTYLVRRRADDEKLDARCTYRELRIGRAQYSSEMGRIIASMQATILRNPPILVDDDEYIKTLNSDADGAGTDLKDLARQILECGLIHKRAYLGPTFPGAIAAGSDLAQALESKALDGRMRFYHAKDVTWWTHAPDGRLDSVRIHTYADQYSRGTWGTHTSREHTWAVIDDVSVSVYTYSQKAKDGQLIPLDVKAPVVIGPVTPHGYDKCPIKEYQFGKSFWVADRLVDPQKRLFNSEADEAFIRSECAHPQKVIIGTPVSETDEFGNAKVKGGPVWPVQFNEPGSDMKLVSPDAAQATWHGMAIDRDRQNLFSALESMSLGIAAQSQNARQAASAKAMDSSHSTLFLAFAAALLEELILTTVAAIKAKRSSASPCTMEGLNKIDGRTIDMAIAEADAFLKLGPPDAAKEWVIRSISARMCAGAPQEVLDEIQTEELEEPEPVVSPASVGAPKPGMSKPAAGDSAEDKSETEDE